MESLIYKLVCSTYKFLHLYHKLTLSIGGGIVYDSDPYDEWMETINKLGANMQCITGAEKIYSNIQSKSLPNPMTGAAKLPERPEGKAHIDIAAG